MDYSRNSFVMSYMRKFTVKVDEVDKEFSRLYDINIPLGANWDEIFGVLTEAIADLKKMQDDAKKKEEEDVLQNEKQCISMLTLFFLLCGGEKREEREMMSVYC